ncbi:MAG: enoyl-CoA hydratase/isomerase family protein [Planctomycetia bacterium]|nr:enoyl-CoA hydratase/isomerase family protein [Planctomycetia bacterium]
MNREISDKKICDKEIPDPVIRRDLSEDLVLLELNRPDRCNCFSSNMLDLFLKDLEDLKKEEKVRVVLIRGKGKAFCSGMDLKEAMEMEKDGSAPKGFSMSKKVHKVLAGICQLPQIVIAAANGPAFGGGGGLVSVCDYIIASSRFGIGFTELKLGLDPTLLYPFLKRRIRRSDLASLLYFGSPINANRAKEIGLIQEIVPEDDLEDRMMEVARQVLEKEPGALRFAKRLIGTDLLPDGNELEDAWKRHCDSWITPAAQEGIQAFLEKRVPHWDQGSF